MRRRDDALSESFAPTGHKHEIVSQVKMVKIRLNCVEKLANS